MGVFTSAVLVVGYTYENFLKLYNEGKETATYTCFLEFCDEHNLELISPHHDCSNQNKLYGIIVKESPDGFYKTINIQSSITDASDYLEGYFRVKPEVFISPNVS